MRVRPMLEPPAEAEPATPELRLGTEDDLEDIAEILRRRDVAVLTGAGLSTDSGIPDYRGATGSLRRHTPMTYQDFVASAAGRQRYWARSHLGWRTITGAQPNSGHRAVAALQGAGYVSGVITQNVDGLHRAAGSPDAIELHGGLDRVICLGCGVDSTREELDERLHAANPGFRDRVASIHVNPDGDVELDDTLIAGFRIASCLACGTGILKPDVVFFGENVPRPRVQQCYDLVDRSQALLVLGSSLTVMSGLRFVRYAAKAYKPVAIINQGQTRGDAQAAVRADLPLGPALSLLARSLEVTVP
ncbi:MAG TPA: NAD-dependent protein deacetylase [Actinospica sp.]|nr:NAD-dependent protein deacetylase [Actinospica sp.]